MAMKEVDELELGKLTHIRDTIAKINQTPEGKLLLQKAHRQVDPNAIAPDLDEEEKKGKLKSELQKELDELKASIQADKEKAASDANMATLNAKFEAGRQKLRDRRYTPEGIERVEKIMQERGITDHEIVADHLERQNPPQEVLSPRAFGSFNFVEPPKDDDKFLKALLDSKGDDDNAVLQAAADAINEVRGQSRR